MAIGDVFKLTVKFGNSLTETKGYNAFVFKQTVGLILDTAPEDLVESWETHALSLYQACFSNNIRIEEYKVGQSPGFETAFVKPIDSTAGTLSGDPMPANTGGLMSLYTATLSKRGRGRIFLPCSVEANNTLARPNSGQRSAMIAFGDALMDMVNDIVTTAGWELQMWSNADQVARVVTSIIVRDYWGSQRDRRFML